MGSFNLVLGAGAFANRFQGLVGNGGDPGNNSSYYFNYKYFGVTAYTGFRINLKKGIIAYNILPVNVLIGSKKFIELSLKLGIDVKL